ncbi:alpha/beta fold hydrolase [Parapedobacter sp.]
MGTVIPPHIHYTLYEPNDGTPVKAAILLLHGMQEHSGRYTGFANYLREQGYAVLAYDHAGHGRTAKTKEQLGFFRSIDPGNLLVDDASRLASYLSQRFPHTPQVLMGHSMGSFVARVLLNKSEHHFVGAILIGTGGPNPMAAFARPILYLANRIAPEKRSRWLNKLFTSINNQKFKHEQPNDGTNWLSASLANRQAFRDDELCGVDFSNNAFYGLICLNVDATRPNWSATIARRMPLFFISGTDDPIGDFGKGVEKVVGKLRNRRFGRVKMKLYPGMRHEVLNETDKAMVYEDIYAWLEETC